MSEEQYRRLRVRMAGGNDGRGGGDGPLVVLLHGYGAGGDDLVPLAQVLRAPAGTRFAFPEAPLSLDSMGMYGGRAWWHLDQAALDRAMRTGVPRDLRDEHPVDLAAARRDLIALLDELDAPPATVLGGFSQGAMLSCDVALHTDRPLAGLLLMSGNFLAANEWTPLMPSRAGLPVLQSHGRQDPLLGFDGAQALRDALSEAGLPVRFEAFDGAHEISPGGVHAASAFLGESLSTAG